MYRFLIGCSSRNSSIVLQTSWEIALPLMCFLAENLRRSPLSEDTILLGMSVVLGVQKHVKL